MPAREILTQCPYCSYVDSMEVLRKVNGKSVLLKCTVCEESFTERLDTKV